MNCWDTDSNKSFDFLLNPICIVVALQSYSVLFVNLSYIIQIKYSLNQVSNGYYVSQALEFMNTFFALSDA